MSEPSAVVSSVHESISLTNIPASGLVVDLSVGVIVLTIYCYRVGGVKSAVGRFRSSNWPWLGREVALPLGIPIAVGLMVVAAAWGVGMNDVPDPAVAIQEMTPWTLAFFSLTLLSSTLSRLSGKVDREGWVTLVWIAIIIVALFAGFLTIARHSKGWSAGIRPYSVAGLLTLLAIWMSHANSKI